jgi:hypothetical protein
MLLKKRVYDVATKKGDATGLFLNAGSAPGDYPVNPYFFLSITKR